MKFSYILIVLLFNLQSIVSQEKEIKEVTDSGYLITISMRYKKDFETSQFVYFLPILENYKIEAFDKKEQNPYRIGNKKVINGYSPVWHNILINNGVQIEEYFLGSYGLRRCNNLTIDDVKEDSTLLMSYAQERKKFFPIIYAEDEDFLFVFKYSKFNYAINIGKVKWTYCLSHIQYDNKKKFLKNGYIKKVHYIAVDLTSEEHNKMLSFVKKSISIDRKVNHTKAPRYRKMKLR